MTVILPIALRDKSSFTNKQSDYIKAVVYGHKFTSTPIMVEKKHFDKVFKEAGESTIIELKGLDKPVSVLIKEVEFSPIRGGVTHVDFYAIELGAEMTVNVPLHFIGEAPVLKQGAVVDKVMHEVTVVCLPASLPSHLDVDLEKLINPEDKLHISDIKLPKGVRITQDSHEVIALAEIMKEEVVEEVTISAAEVPVEKKGKDDKEEAAA
jgi:large subunit ribosomal protein L25